MLTNQKTTEMKEGSRAVTRRDSPAVEFRASVEESPVRLSNTTVQCLIAGIACNKQAGLFNFWKKISLFKVSKYFIYLGDIC